MCESPARFRAAFDEIDADGGGTLSYDELKEAMRELDVEITTKEAKAMIAQVDKTGSGEVRTRALAAGQALACGLSLLAS